MNFGRSSTAEVADVGRKHLELYGVDVGLVFHALAVPLARGKVGRNGAGSFEGFQVMLEAGPGQHLPVVQNDSLEDFARGAGAVLVQVTQDGRVGSVSKNFDGCLNLLRVIGLDEARHASILPDYLDSSESQNKVYR
jgi:hypothetical protein